MLVIALASQKGGSGKTTLSGHLAVEAEKAGAGPVALVDTDPQGSLAAWWNVRTEKTPAFAKVGVFDLQSALEQLKRSGIKLVVIDTPPAITDAISHVISLADLILVPCRPSPHDLRSVGATADLADRHKKALIFIVNAADSAGAHHRRGCRGALSARHRRAHHNPPPGRFCRQHGRWPHRRRSHPRLRIGQGNHRALDLHPGPPRASCEGSDARAGNTAGLFLDQFAVVERLGRLRRRSIPPSRPRTCRRSTPSSRMPTRRLCPRRPPNSLVPNLT